jgi:23S rRNA (uracil1939-C5)-methyltransferase
LGYFHKGTWFKIVDVKDCYLFDARIAPILEDLRAWVARHDFKAFHNRRFTGLLRNFVLRKSISTDEWLVGLITTPEELSDEQMIELKDMISKHVNVISFWQRLIDPKRKKGETFTDRLVWGQEYITENLAGVDYQIRFGDFFQNNVPQATKMVEYSLGLIKPEENSRILDLYCGVGTFTLPLAREFDAPVHGVEIVETAIRSAEHNAQINGIDGLTFECADVGKVVENTFATNYYDIVVVDPPRAGLVKSVVEQILQAQPKQIVYVSCNPSTLARDLDMLAEKYEIHHIKPFDLFPQTYHVECVAYLTLK